MKLLIRELRHKKGWTQLKLAQGAGIDRPATISELERGKNPNPNLDTLLQIAAALGVPPRQLFPVEEADYMTEEVIRWMADLSHDDKRAVVRFVKGFASGQ